jgi:hypothetical protein
LVHAQRIFAGHTIDHAHPAVVRLFYALAVVLVIS